MLSIRVGHLVPSDRELDHERSILIRELYLWMIFGPERYICFSPLHSSSQLDALSQASLSLPLSLLSLSIQGDG
jgi:hypothetical protein